MLMLQEMYGEETTRLEPGRAAFEHLFDLDPAWHHLNHGCYGAAFRWAF